LVEPSNAELAAKMGLKTVAKRSHYDLLIVGGDPAGLLAGIYSAREGIDTPVLERAALGRAGSDDAVAGQRPRIPSTASTAQVMRIGRDGTRSGLVSRCCRPKQSPAFTVMTTTTVCARPTGVSTVGRHCCWQPAVAIDA